jgi:hypothetical protein
VKSYFKKLAGWQLVHSENDPSGQGLERLVFFKDYGTGKKIYLVADAYRGDKMKGCLEDFFRSLSGEKSDVVTVNKEKIAIFNQADLLVFNGHNGLMDTSVKSFENEDGVMKDAAVIPCISTDFFFNEPLNFLKVYSVLTTTSLLAPEVYVLESLVENWAVLNDGNSFKIAAGKAYHRFQKCKII